jgi:hypothetical protein
MTSQTILDEIETYLSKYRQVSYTPALKVSYEDQKEQKDQETETDSSFNKSWCKLGLTEKINRLMRYHSKLVAKCNMTHRQSEALKKFFYDNVNAQLASDEYVSYDIDKAEIVTIIGLKQDDETFYMNETNTKPEGIRIKYNKVQDINQVTAMSSLQSKKTIVVVKK